MNPVNQSGHRRGSEELSHAAPARRNLFHDKVRLTVTLTGIVFAAFIAVK